MCLFLLIGVCFFFATSSLHADEYEVEGTIKLERFDRDGMVEWKNTADFTVFVRGCAWLIQLRNGDQNGLARELREIASTNGTEIFDMSKVIAAGNQPPPVKYGMNVVSNSVPVGRNEGELHGHLWQMFASQCFWGGKTEGPITPVYDSVAFASRYRKVDAAWELMDGTGSLPLKVSFFGQLSRADAVRVVSGETVPRAENTNMHAQYRANGVTNAGNVNVANGFVFEKYLPGRIPKVLTRVECAVTAVRPACSREDLMPNADGKTQVTDFRQRGTTNQAPAFTYVKPKDEWPTASEALEIRNNRRARKVSPVLIALLGAVLLAPVAYFGVAAMKRRSASKAKVKRK